MRGRQNGNHTSTMLDMRVTEMLWAAAIALMLFQPALQRSIAAMSWLDEVITLLLAACALIAVLRKGPMLPGMVKASLRFSALFVVVCLIGNIASGVPGSVLPIFIDAFTCVKFFVAAASSLVVFYNKGRLLEVMMTLSKVFILVVAVCAAISLVSDIGMSYSQIRYGLRPFVFVFPHPTYLAVALTGVIVLLSADAERNTSWILLASAMMVLTLRGKAMGFAALVLLVLFLSRRGKKGVGLLQVILLGGVALVIGWGQVEAYFGTDGQARSELLSAGLRIAFDDFPIGAGFASFGSAITSEPSWYSPLYFQYGISNVWGLSQEYSGFISDSFWPTVLGQSGILGLIFYCVSLFLLLRAMFRLSSSQLPVLLFTAYLLIMSTSESAFFNPSSVYLALCVAIAALAHADRLVDTRADISRQGMGGHFDNATN